MIEIPINSAEYIIDNLTTTINNVSMHAYWRYISGIDLRSNSLANQFNWAQKGSLIKWLWSCRITGSKADIVGGEFLICVMTIFSKL